MTMLLYMNQIVKKQDSYFIPEASRTAKGSNIRNVLEMADGITYPEQKANDHQKTLI